MSIYNRKCCICYHVIVDVRDYRVLMFDVLEDKH